MNEQLDDILDECSERILSGELDIAGCVERYPQHADVLAELLETALSLRGPQSSPSPQAALHGEQLLLRAVLAKQAQGEARSLWARIGERLLLPRVRVRWAAALATILVVLLVGVGAVATSSDALPGESLYWVKRTTEQVRLAIAFSESSKARLQLALAERRVDELSRLTGRGDTEFTASLIDDLRHHLQEAQSEVAAVKDQETAADLRAKLESSASTQLARIQDELVAAATEVQPTVSAAFSAVSEEYGEALETAIRESPPPVVAAGLGLLQIFATDPPPPKLDAVLVEVRAIEVHRAGGPEGGWTTIVPEPVSFDLLRVAEIQKFLGSQQIESGVYTQIRFEVSKATVIADGQEHDAELPSGRLKLTRPFRVEAEQTTVLLLDFEGAASVKVTGAGRYKLTPQVRVLAREPKAMSQEEGGSPETNEAPGTLPSGPETGVLQAVKGAKVELEGPIESISDGRLVIRGQPVLITDETEVVGTLVQGAVVTVEALRQDDGTWIALEVIVAGEREKPEVPERPDGGGGKGGGEGNKGPPGGR